jgi:hypothetical protein
LACWTASIASARMAFTTSACVAAVEGVSGMGFPARTSEKTPERTVRSKKYAIILAHFFTAIFFAWVNLCKEKEKDCTRRPGFEGVPPSAERPRSRAQSHFLSRTFAWKGVSK